MKRLHWLQHVPFEGLGSIEAWAMGKGFSIDVTRWHLGDSPPAPQTPDWLVIMGGPMNIYEEDQYPWLREEKRFIDGAVRAGKVVLGICLGAQLLADVLGAGVRRGSQREIGWFEVQKDPAALADPLAAAFPDAFTAFHWHGDMFDIPQGAVPLGRSQACANQGFLKGLRVAALQFHLETTAASAADLITHCGHEIVAGDFIQGAEQMMGNGRRFESINGLMARFLDRLYELNG